MPNLVVDYTGADHVRADIGSRLVQQLSDGSWVMLTRPTGTSFHLRRSTDKINWTLLNTITVTAVDSLQSYGLTVDASDNLHFVQVNGSRQVIYRKLTYSAGPTFSVGGAETAIDTPASGSESLFYPTVEVIDSAVIVVACLGIDGTNNSKIRVRARNTSNTWGTVHTYTLPVLNSTDGAAIACSISRDIAAAAGGAQRVVVSACGGKNSNYVIAGFSVTLTTGAIANSFAVSSNSFPLMPKGMYGYLKGYSASAGRWRFIAYASQDGTTGSVAAFEVNIAGAVVASAITTAPGYALPVSNTALSGRVTSFGMPDRLVLVGLRSTVHQLDYISAIFASNTVSFRTKQMQAFTLDSTSTIGYSYLQGGDANRNIGVGEHLLVIVNAADAKVYSHYLPAPTEAPTSVVPAAGSSVGTDIPTLQANIGFYAINGARAEWQVATNAAFSVGLRTVACETDATSFSTGNPLQGAQRYVCTQVMPVAVQLSQAVWYVRARVSDVLGQGGPWTTANNFSVIHPPTADPLNPDNNNAKDYGAGTLDFEWMISDTSPVDVQTAYQIVVERNSDAASVVDTGKITAAGFAPNNSYGSPTIGRGTAAIGGGYKDTLLQWKVRLWDSDDVVGPYSAYGLFYTSDLPTITITNPSDNEVLDNPMPLFTWTFAASGGRTQSSFRLVIVNNANGATIHDSGNKASSDSSYQLPLPLLVNDGSYTVTLTVQDSLGLVNSDTAPFTTEWTPPAAPSPVTVSVATFDADGFVTVGWDETDRDAEFYEWRIYRRVDNTTDMVLILQSTDPDLDTFEDWTALSEVAYEYNVAQVANRFGSLVESDPVWQSPVTPSGSHYWLIHPDDNTKNIKVFHVISDDFTDEYESASFNLIGRGRKRDYGTHFGRTGTFVCQVRNYNGKTARQIKTELEDIKAERRELLLKNPFGDLWQVALGDLQVSRTAGTGTNEFCTVTVPYEEVV